MVTFASGAKLGGTEPVLDATGEGAAATSAATPSVATDRAAGGASAGDDVLRGAAGDCPVSPTGAAILLGSDRFDPVRRGGDTSNPPSVPDLLTGVVFSATAVGSVMSFGVEAGLAVASVVDDSSVVAAGCEPVVDVASDAESVPVVFDPESVPVEPDVEAVPVEFDVEAVPVESDVEAVPVDVEPVESVVLDADFEPAESVALDVDSEFDESDADVEPDEVGSANATPGVDPRANPTPNATAKQPTRPMYLLQPMIMSPPRARCDVVSRLLNRFAERLDQLKISGVGLEKWRPRRRFRDSSDLRGQRVHQSVGAIEWATNRALPASFQQSITGPAIRHPNK